MSASFASRLLAWFAEHGRHHLPWQHPRDPYRVWIAEIMLQQTQVATVVPYFQRFVATFPDLRALAAADEEAVLRQWSGLGYYRRARFLHEAAKHLVAEHDGTFPRNRSAIEALPGIGRSTAAAILAQAWGERASILDGNVKRVLARHRGIEGWPGQSQVERQLWQQAEALTPASQVADYTQAIMDLGATVCTRAKPRCVVCPVASDCFARRHDAVARLPAARPRRRLPSRHTAMLVDHDAGGRVRLVKRPPAGVWPALWSLPESAHVPPDRRRVDGFEHSFSHYRLRAELYVAPLPNRNVADSAGERWIDLASLDDVALPAPVRSRLIRFLENEEWRAR